MIRAQEHPPAPKDKIEEVLCDATLMFITTESGVEQFDLLCDEIAMQKVPNVKRSLFEKEYIDIAFRAANEDDVRDALRKLERLLEEGFAGRIFELTKGRIR